MQLTSRFCRPLLGALVTLSLLPLTAKAQTIDPFFAGSYTLTSLGSAPDVPTNYGGLVVKAGDANTLLLGGAANGVNGAIYNVNLVRNGSNQITGFTGTSTVLSTAPNIDGGLAYHPNGALFYTGYPINQLGQIRPGSVTPDKIIDLSPFGIASSVGTLIFTPAGQLRLVSWSGGQYYNVTLSPDGSGTFDVVSASLLLTLPGGPEGLVYVPGGSPLFPNPSVLVSEYSAGEVSAYDIDANGDPILGTRRTFITGLSGAEGATIDPVTGDFLFSTFGGGNQVVVVRGFAAPPTGSSAPEPGTATLTILGLTLIAGRLAKRRRG